ncbi:alpha/beta hydrolase [Microbacterium sp. Mu-80]|uniref:Alpha/beta hydrolase n=1 Tax=Microbacterium bandirmense TaxID=3122050 RepID=A0ABU8L7N5_9MICO
MESLIEINGTHLFVDERGRADGRPLLFIHGGPGNSCWDFMASVGDAFAARGFRVIGVDQRGVLRSDVLPHEPGLTVDVLIRDFEALREHLGLENWTVIGHSSGGAYAFDYALQHPDRIDALVLDCPALDADATDRFRLPKAAALLDEAAGSDADGGAALRDAAAECRRLATLDRRLTADDRTWGAMLPLGPHYLDLFLHDASTRARYERLMGAAPDHLDWGKGMSHLPLMAEMYRDQTLQLTQLTVPSTLLIGESDMVAPPVVRDVYRAATGHDVVTISDAGHFAFVEQPERYVDAVARFLDAPGEGAA